MTLKNRMSFTEIQFKKDLDLVNNILKSNGYYKTFGFCTKETLDEQEQGVMDEEIPKKSDKVLPNKAP